MYRKNSALVAGIVKYVWVWVLKSPPHPKKSEQSGAVEACWAHNPEVGGSKPLSAEVFECYIRIQSK